jgi:hypothetical protein
MATKHTVTRRVAFLNPIRTVCAWCAGQNRPAAVLVDVPIDDRGLSHGICAACLSRLRSTRRRSSAGPRPDLVQRSHVEHALR